MPAKMPWFFYEESKIHDSDHCHSFSPGICLTSKSKCSILFRNIDGMRRLIGKDTRVSILKKTLNRQETNVQSNFFNPTLANCGMSGMFCYYDTNSPCSFNSTGNNAAVALRKINGIYNLWPAMHTALLVTILMGTNKANILFDWFCLQFASSIELQILYFKKYSPVKKLICFLLIWTTVHCCNESKKKGREASLFAVGLSGIISAISSPKEMLTF